ncbi:P-loop NTPase fold protein [Thalassospira povalilytica]|uniref:P-loop NTPase fold protein n=1 Tax=Thalassospira povalilytica TaxID=732237 RepID=UPI003AA8B681
MESKRTIKTYERQILIDEPSDEDLFHGRGHEKTARSLARAISEFAEEDRAIGLDGPWGSGKSSIVEISSKYLKENNISGDRRFHFFTFDVWKSQGASFRRSVLEELVTWAMKEFPRKKSQLKKVEKNIKGKTRKVDTNHRVRLDWYGVSVIMLIPLLPIYYFWAKEVFDSSEGLGFFNSAPFYVVLSFFGLTFLRAKSIWIRAKMDDDEVTFLDAMSQTLMLSARHYENKSITQHIRELDPNDFEFQSVFRNILSIVQDKKNKIVLVLDNIDRLPADEIEEYWALVRSVFSRVAVASKHSDFSPITAVVPYDRHHIVGLRKGIKRDIDGGSEAEPYFAGISSRELFSKTFDEVLTVSPPVMSNSKEFFEEKISKSLPKLDEKDQLFRVFLIFDFVIREESGAPTPRQIISFINEVSGLFSMHEGRFPVPTVAVFVCYKDLIAEDPLFTNGLRRIPGRVLSLCNDPELQKNIAAILYNVEPELAYQVLLDQRIKDSAIQSDSDELVTLSPNPGFDIRVVEVIRDSIEEWLSAGDFSQVVYNFSRVLDDYEGSSRKLLVDTLVDVYPRIELLDIRKSDYRKLLDIVEFCSLEQVEVVVRNVLEAAAQFISADIEVGAEFGKLWNSFLEEVSSVYASVITDKPISTLVGGIHLPAKPEFILEVASEASSTAVSLASYRDVNFELDEGSTLVEEYAVNEPERACSAVKELLPLGLLEPNKIVSVGAAVVTALGEGGKEDEFVAYMSILRQILPKLKKDGFSSVALSDIYSRHGFYEAFAANKDGNDAVEAVALSLCFALMLFDDISDLGPKTANQNGVMVVEETPSFLRFKKCLDGELGFGSPEAKLAADYAKSTGNSRSLVTRASSTEAPLFLEAVVRSIFVEGVPPFYNLKAWLEPYPYVESLVGEEIALAVDKFAERVTEKELKQLELGDVPLNLFPLAIRSQEPGWKLFCNKIVDLLNATKASQWLEWIRVEAHEGFVLAEAASKEAITISDVEYRQVLLSVVLDIARGELELRKLRLDHVLLALDEGYFSELYRSAREQISQVTPVSLNNLVECAPDFVRAMIEVEGRVKPAEKDNVIRYILCPALEGDLKVVLSWFVSLGYSRVSKILKGSDEATEKMLGAALKGYTKLSGDYTFRKSVVETIQGKRRTSNFFDVFAPFVSGRYGSGDK